MSEENKPVLTTRREFTKRMAVLAAAAPLASCAPAVGAGEVGEVDPRISQPSAGEDDAADPVVDDLFEVLRHRYGEHLSDEQLQDIRGQVRGALHWADLMKGVELQNGDGPACGLGRLRGGL